MGFTGGRNYFENKADLDHLAKTLIKGVLDELYFKTRNSKE